MKKRDRARRSFSCSRWWCVDICAYHICEHATTCPLDEQCFLQPAYSLKVRPRFNYKTFIFCHGLATCGSEQARAEGVTNNLSAEARKYEVQAQ